MENALRVWWVQNGIRNPFFVLILVLMENALRVQKIKVIFYQ